MAYVIWFAILSERWGVRGLGQGATGNFAAPFVALAQQLAIVFGRAPAAQLEIAELVLVSATVIACFAIYRGTIFTAGVLPLSFAIYFVAAVFYSTYIWQDDYAYLRAVHELFLCAALSLIAAATWFTRGLALSTVVLWFSSAVQRGFNP
jgi:hypothetical protein